MTQLAPSRDLQASREAHSTTPTPLPKFLKTTFWSMSRALESWEALARKASVSFTCKVTFGPGNPKMWLKTLQSGSCYPSLGGRGHTGPISLPDSPSFLLFHQRSEQRLRTKDSVASLSPLLLSPVHGKDLGVHPPASPACELLRRARRKKRRVQDSIVATSLLWCQKRCGNGLSLAWVLSTSVGGTERTWQLDFLVSPEQFP